MGAGPKFGHAAAKSEIADVARTPEGKTLLKRYLNEITEGPAFKGSPRSAQFLEYVIWQSAVGKIADLKERTIGIELFGRTPTYDTGEDAIVRVTASDVRKRLVQHYSGVGNASEFRISLPPGRLCSRTFRTPKVGKDGLATHLSVDERPVETPAQGFALWERPNNETSANWKHWILPILGIIALTVGIALTIVNRPGLTASGGKRVGSTGTMPWASLFDGSRRVLIIASDPNIEEIQRMSLREPLHKSF